MRQGKMLCCSALKSDSRLLSVVQDTEQEGGKILITKYNMLF